MTGKNPLSFFCKNRIKAMAAEIFIGVIAFLVFFGSTISIAQTTLNRTLTSFIQPCPDSGGYRGWLGGPNKNHLGYDYNAPAGTEVKAISHGTIYYINLNMSGFGGSEPSKPGPMMWIRHRLKQ
jgi:hypothetical protein